jgi:hypothetical protein
MNAYLGRHRGGRRRHGGRRWRGGYGPTPLWYEAMPYVAPTCYRDGQGRVWCLQQSPVLGAAKPTPPEPKRWYRRPLAWVGAGLAVLLVTGGQR